MIEVQAGQLDRSRARLLGTPARSLMRQVVKDAMAVCPNSMAEMGHLASYIGVAADERWIVVRNGIWPGELPEPLPWEYRRREVVCVWSSKPSEKLPNARASRRSLRHTTPYHWGKRGATGPLRTEGGFNRHKYDPFRAASKPWGCFEPPYYYEGARSGRLCGDSRARHARSLGRRSICRRSQHSGCIGIPPQRYLHCGPFVPSLCGPRARKGS